MKSVKRKIFNNVADKINNKRFFKGMNKFNGKFKQLVSANLSSIIYANIKTRVIDPISNTL